METDFGYGVKTFKVLTVGRNETRQIPALKKNIFITYQHTLQIKKLIEHENWGEHNKRLYSYLDYTFRARIVDKQVKVYDFGSNDVMGLFSTGLNFAGTHEEMYIIFHFIPDNSKKQQWSVSTDPKDTNGYCMSKRQISIKYGIHPDDIPQKWDYSKVSKRDFNWNYKCYFDWNLILRKILNRRLCPNGRDIILDEFGKNGIRMDPKLMRQKLVSPFENAVRNAIDCNNIEYGSHIRPGIYFTKNGYELNFQMLINVEYPFNSGKITKFAILMKKKFHKYFYSFSKLLTAEMAMKNSRLIGKVPNQWYPMDDDIWATPKEEEEEEEEEAEEENDDMSMIDQGDEDIPENLLELSPNFTEIKSNDSNISNGSNSSNDSSISSFSSISSIKSDILCECEYPKFYKIQKTRILMKISDGEITETCSQIKTQIGSSLKQGEEEEEDKQCAVLKYKISSSPFFNYLLDNKQITIETVSEICEINEYQSVKTIYTNLSDVNGFSVSQNIHSCLSTLTKDGCITNVPIKF